MASLLSYALTTVEDVKESLGIVSSDTTKDNLIKRKINQATLAIENYTGRHFKETTYTNEEYPATHTNQLVLAQRPITSLTSLQVRDAGLNENSWNDVETSLYFAGTDKTAGVIDTLFNARGRSNSYRVTYTAGYATIPEDLAEACASLAAYYVTNADGTDVGVMKKKEGQRELQYSNGSLSFDNILSNLGIDGIINSYSNYPVLSDS